MLSNTWHWIVIVFTVANILACWWLIRWSAKTKVDSDDNTTGHTWDEDLQELNNPLPRWWLILFYVSIAFCFVYLYFYPGLGNFAGQLKWTQISQLEENTRAAEQEIQQTQEFWNQYSEEHFLGNQLPIKTGERVFTNNCAMCHGSGGKGAPGYPNLVDAAWQWGDSFETLIDVVANGREALMQPWLEELGEQGVREVTEYVQHLGGLSHDSEMAEAGETHYQRTCIACHGVTGTGMQALGAPDLTDGYWLYGSDDEALYDTIAHGRTGKMPAHKDLLNLYKIRAVVAYLKDQAANPGTGN